LSTTLTDYLADLQVLAWCQQSLAPCLTSSFDFPVVALRAGSVNAFISCAHRGFQLLIDVTPRARGERNAIWCEKMGDEELTDDVQLGASLAKLN